MNDRGLHGFPGWKGTCKRTSTHTKDNDCAIRKPLKTSALIREIRGSKPIYRINPAHQSAGFIHPELLILLGLLPLGIFLFLSAERKRLRDAECLAGPRGADSEHRRQRLWAFIRLSTAAGLIILALARPTWNEITLSTAREGRDIVFLLDVSRSMLAQDLSPNRLGAAKTAIRDCVNALENDRVALVVFAGSTSILCPLTNDSDFFFDKLEEAHPDFIAPGDVRIGGTRIGDAIHKICDKLLTKERRGFQDIVLLSDGGDQDSNPARAAQRLDTLGVHFVVAGLGDAVTGARIPAREEAGTGPEFVLFKGHEVWSKLESNSLNVLAKSCRYGVFLNAGTRPLPLGDIYQKLATHFQRQHPGNREDLMRKQDIFPLFLGLAFLCLAVPPGRIRRSPALLIAGVLAALTGFVPGNSVASPGPTLFQKGLKQMNAKNFTDSAESFRAASEAFPDSPRRALALYNAGLACFLQARADEMLDPMSSQNFYRQSCASFRAALEMQPSLEDSRWNLELALRRLALMTRPDESPENGKDPSSQSQNPNRDQEQSKKEGEEKDEQKADQDRSAQESNQMSGQNAVDLNAQDLPPPMAEPEDIFRQERESAEVRQKTSGSRSRPVEKDW